MKDWIEFGLSLLTAALFIAAAISWGIRNHKREKYWKQIRDESIARTQQMREEETV